MCAWWRDRACWFGNPFLNILDNNKRNESEILRRGIEQRGNGGNGRTKARLKAAEIAKVWQVSALRDLGGKTAQVAPYTVRNYQLMQRIT